MPHNTQSNNSQTGASDFLKIELVKEELSEVNFLEDRVFQ